MRFIGECLRRLGYLLNRRRHERDLQREMEYHRAMMGEPARFGNTLRLREEARDVWGWNWLDSACQDLKFASRTLRHSPGFTVGAVVILGLGLGLNLTLFQIDDSVVLQPFHVRGVESIVEFVRMSPRRFFSGPIPFAAAQFIHDNNNGVLSAVLTQDRWKTVLFSDSEEPISARFVSSNWFDELGYGALQGRLFHETVDDPPGASAVVAVSYRYWANQLNRDPHVIGTNVRINGRPATLIGVVPDDFPIFGGHPAQLWLPIEQYDYFIPDTSFRTAWDNTETELFARLKPGLSPAAARDALRPALGELAHEHPRDFRRDEWFEPYLATNHFESPPDRTRRLLTVTGLGFLSLLVLGVACANLGNLVLSRSVGRLRELTVRTALGANRWRVMRHLLAESALLAGMGALLGLAISSIVIYEIASRVEIPLAASPDWRTLLAMLFGAAFVLIAVGLVPTWSVTRRDLNTAIKDGGEQASAGLGQQRLRSLLSALQVAGSCILLLLATLAARNLRQSLSPGMDIDKVAVFEPAGLGNAIQTLRGQDGKALNPLLFWNEMRPAIAELPEAAETALVTFTPFVGPFAIENLPEAPDLTITLNDIEPQFFKLMGIPIIAGRAFDASDDPGSVVIISRRMAMQVYGILNVVGQSFPPTPPQEKGKTQRTIVGVAEETSLPIGFKNGFEDVAEYYLPFSRDKLNLARLLVRARSSPVGLWSAMREAARRTDS